MSEHSVHTSGHDEHHGLDKRKIFQVLGILVLITAIEFIIALWAKPNGYLGAAETGTMVANVIYIVLTLLKAFYIVAYFMHLKYEKLGLQLALSVSFIFIIYFIVLMFIEGGYLFDHMPQV